MKHSLHTHLPVRSCKASVAEIQAAVCKHYRTALDGVLGRDRNVTLVYVRLIAMFCVYELTGLPSTFIGREFRRHPSWVCKSVRRVEELASRDMLLRVELDALRDELCGVIDLPAFLPARRGEGNGPTVDAALRR